MSGGTAGGQTDQTTGQQSLTGPNSDVNRHAFHVDQIGGPT